MSFCPNKDGLVLSRSVNTPDEASRNDMDRGVSIERRLGEMKRYEYDTILHEMVDNGGAYVAFPWDIREEFGKGRVKVHAMFDGIPYDGSIVNMGVKNPDGSICYIIGVLKAIRNKLNKHDGDIIHMVIEEKERQDAGT